MPVPGASRCSSLWLALEGGGGGLQRKTFRKPARCATGEFPRRHSIGLAGEPDPSSLPMGPGKWEKLRSAWRGVGDGCFSSKTGQPHCAALRSVLIWALFPSLPATAPYLMYECVCVCVCVCVSTLPGLSAISL